MRGPLTVIIAKLRSCSIVPGTMSSLSRSASSTPVTIPEVRGDVVISLIG